MIHGRRIAVRLSGLVLTAPTIVGDPSAWVLAEPWDWPRLGIGNPTLVSGGITSIAGTGSPRLLVPADRRLRLGPHVPPVLGPSLVAGRGQRLIPRAIPGERQPGDGRKQLAMPWVTVDQQGTLFQEDFLPRPRPLQPDSCGAPLDIFVTWALGRFQELAHADGQAGGITAAEWQRAVALWQDYDPSAPTMDLIVRMAKDGRLAEALAAIARQPRRVLVRIRDEVRVDRVQELDAACIRAFARRPGTTAIEKAGARQTLLAVRRQASHDTLENRLTAWVLDELAQRSRRWLDRHRQARSTDKAQAVCRLESDSQDRRRSEALAEVGTAALVHPVLPNYPLQQDRRYGLAYEAYRRLLRHGKEEDDAWTWRRGLWTDAVRQLIATSLLSLGVEGFRSQPHYRQETEVGSWLARPCEPGPLDLGQRGTWHVLDALTLAAVESRRSYSGEPWLASLGDLGADLWLWCQRPKRLVPVWAILDTAESPDAQRLSRAAEALEAWLHMPTSPARSGYSCHGLVVVGQLETRSLQIDLEQCRSGRAPIVGLAIPLALAEATSEAYREMMRNLHAGIELTLDEG